MTKDEGTTKPECRKRISSVFTPFLFQFASLGQKSDGTPWLPGMLPSFAFRHSFDIRHLLHAPRILETCGSESTRAAISDGSAFLISSTVIALATSKRPDLTRLSE